MLTQEAAAALLYQSLQHPDEPEEIEQPEEPEPEEPPGYVPTFSAASGEKIATALEQKILNELTEASGLDATHFKVTEGTEGIIVNMAKFFGDRWSEVNTILEGMGFDYVSDKSGVKFWGMNKPKPKPETKPEAKNPKKTQQRIEKPKTIREVEALLISKFGATILKSVSVTEDGKNLDVEPQTKLAPELIKAITNHLTKFGGTQMDTGMPPGYVWVIGKGT